MKKIVHNVETNEISEIEMTKDEIQQLQTDEAQYDKRREEEQVQAQAKAVQRASILERLGLTEEEAKVLLG